MDYKERKWKDYIREALIIRHQHKLLSNSGNPYAGAESLPELNSATILDLSEQAIVIYNHLIKMGMIK